MRPVSDEKRRGTPHPIDVADVPLPLRLVGGRVVQVLPDTRGLIPMGIEAIRSDRDAYRLEHVAGPIPAREFRQPRLRSQRRPELSMGLVSGRDSGEEHQEILRASGHPYPGEAGDPDPRPRRRRPAGSHSAHAGAESPDAALEVRAASGLLHLLAELLDRSDDVGVDLASVTLDHVAKLTQTDVELSTGRRQRRIHMSFGAHDPRFYARPRRLSPDHCRSGSAWIRWSGRRRSAAVMPPHLVAVLEAAGTIPRRVGTWPLDARPSSNSPVQGFRRTVVQTSPATPPLLSFREVAAQLGVSLRYVGGLREAGTLPVVRLGARCLRVRPEDLRTLIEAGLRRGPLRRKRPDASSGSSGRMAPATPPYTPPPPSHETVPRKTPRTAASKSSPPNLYRSTTACRSCEDCRAGRTCRAKKTMKTWWCRFSFDGVVYRRTTGCRDTRNAIRRAAVIRVELEAELRGVAPRKRVAVADAVADFRRNLAGGRGGPEQQARAVALVEEVLEHGTARFVDQLDCGIYDAWIAEARKARPGKPGGLATWSIHMRAQAVRRFGKWLEDSDRVRKSPFRQVQLISGAKDARRRRALSFEDLEHLFRVTRTRPLEEAHRSRVLSGVTPSERDRLRRIGRRRSLVLRTLARSGVRPNELRQVTVAQVDVADRTIFLPADVAKARRRELVHLTPDLARRLAALIRSLGPGAESRTLFASAIPNSRTFDRDIEAAGLPKEDLRRGDLCVYSMRKSFSTHLRMCGVDDDMVGRLMRHSGSSLNSRVYTDAGLLDLREPMRRLDARDKEQRRAWRRGQAVGSH